jgi:hypothetical protein
MADPFAASSNSHEQSVAVAQVNHLPVVADFGRRLGLAELDNRLVQVDMTVEFGVIGVGVVLDNLSGRSPLYHMESAFSDCDRAVLFGQEVPANTFSDDNVGRVMDRIFAASTQRLFSTLSVTAMGQSALAVKDAVGPHHRRRLGAPGQALPHETQANFRQTVAGGTPYATLFQSTARENRAVSKASQRPGREAV